MSAISSHSGVVPMRAVPLSGQSADKVVFSGVSKTYGSKAASMVAVESFDVTIKAAEIVSILGPTGCGKSTAMNMIAGFEFPSTGAVLLDGKPVTGPGPERAVVFQQAALFPWLSCLENIVLGVKSRGMPRDEYLRRAEQLIAAVRLTGFENHYPYQLSGGMQQRVQIARALISGPEVLLMDEPFGALDSQTRLMMQELVLQLWQEYKPTIIFITHDVAEAVFVSDRVLLMSRRPGRVKLSVEIDEKKPRTQDFISSPRFVELQKQLLTALRAEVGELGGPGQVSLNKATAKTADH
ncbi:ABC transporter ATP-binding protein [Lacisediminimonas sp.]|uniref:ABC transporter ATP-binding protein n=1 Tax=Lacisediminimonas sp. TaxID=3060582 RepID=UPI0027173D9A|nr:ABC transporter ATP-binding protein [Lacisediminimonas sp.]MDO8298735.1 ABC transporter ATP-binding protein [Lacisediminimonas sp.]MDO9218030.1 ABC transporter ATP-binding protein [Lacisediminimonas sp.]